MKTPLPLSLGFVLMVMGVAGATASSCPSGYAHYFSHGTPTGNRLRPYQASCYQFFTDQQNWLDARRRCKAVRGDLVSIETAGEQHHLVTIISGHSNLQKPALTDIYYWGYWTSGTDAPKEGTWRWSATGRSVTYNQWQRGEPTNRYHGRLPENCLSLHRSWGYKWNDLSCLDNFMSYICEAKALS